MMNKMKKPLLYLSMTVLLVFIFLIIFKIVKPTKYEAVGQTFSSEGRNHVEDGTKVNYKTNPPTSGTHYKEWVKAGVYTEIPPDEKLVHSLEHGYIIISYNCDFPEDIKSSLMLIPKIYAHNESETTVSTNSGSTHLEFNKWQDDTKCQELIDNITSIATSVKLWKLIVVPRPQLDNRIALSAWTKLDKLNKIDAVRIKLFIQSFRDKGPEKTMD